MNFDQNCCYFLIANLIFFLSTPFTFLYLFANAWPFFVLFCFTVIQLPLLFLVTLLVRIVFVIGGHRIEASNRMDFDMRENNSVMNFNCSISRIARHFMGCLFHTFRAKYLPLFSKTTNIIWQCNIPKMIDWPEFRANLPN